MHQAVALVERFARTIGRPKLAKTVADVSIRLVECGRRCRSFRIEHEVWYCAVSGTAACRGAAWDDEVVLAVPVRFLDCRRRPAFSAKLMSLRTDW